MPELRVITALDFAALEAGLKTAFPQLHALNLQVGRLVAEPDVDLPVIGVTRLRIDATYVPDGT